ncbi:MAG TPA: hypothetical protein VNJ01_12705 [Bacteriovoracaceae bacterium]|nr:hypothetical protein [Bacteriovoracaceae bacterium]
MLFPLIALLFALPLKATTFKPQAIVEQIKEADGIIIGLYLGRKSVRLENGSIATQMIFKMNKEFGMQSEIFGMDEVIVHYPGGQVGDSVVKVEGVPAFVTGEKVALMIKSIQDRYWGLNLGFGSFKVINYGKETLLLNYVFPEDPKVSQMKLEEFEKNIKFLKGKNLRVVPSPDFTADKKIAEAPRFPASSAEAKNRTLASNSFEEKNTAENSAPVSPQDISVLWLVVLLSLMGGFFRFLRQEKVK